MLLGSLPVYFVILPCVLAGAFQLRKSEGPMYESLASVAIMLATVCQVSTAERERERRKEEERKRG